MAHTNARLFVMYRRNIDAQGRHDANQKAAEDAVQFEGVQFDDGSVAVRWRTPIHSTSVWTSMDDLLAVHGHPEYGSELVWVHKMSNAAAQSLEALRAARDKARDLADLAPEMYEALRNLMGLAQREGWTHVDVDAARAALAKVSP